MKINTLSKKNINERVIFFAFYSIIILLFSNKLHSQTIQTDYNNTIQKFSLANPDVYNFEKYSLTDINYYVGKPNISIPIYTIKTGNIEYPINLVYNSGGVKVDQLASDVGLGWSLTSSIITRTINGDNDFDNLGSLNLQSDYNTYSTQDQTQDINARIISNYKISPKIGYFLEKQTNHKIDNNGHSVIDFIPDTYHFYGGEYSTNFFFNDINTAIELEHKGTLIEATASKVRIDTKRGYYNYPNSGWNPNYNFLTKDFFNINITTNKGLKYTFADCDYSINQMLENNGFTYVPYDSPAQISAWHVTSIEDKNTSKRIDFVYENTSSNPNGSNQPNGYDSLASQKYFEYISSPQQNPNNSLCSYYSALNGFYDTYKLNRSARVDIQKKRLKKIIFESGSVNFIYNSVARSDVYNGDYITQVIVKDNNNNIIKTYNLVYDYFTSNYNVGEFNPDNAQNNYRYKRLKLLSFGESGKPTYKFYYNEIIKLPPVNSFAIDFLGYYNGSTDITTPLSLTSTRANPTLYYYINQFDKSILPFPVPNVTPSTIIPGIFNRQSEITSAKAWSLNKIEYPTGGSSEYNYELNEFEVFGQTVRGGGLRILNQILNDDNGNSRTINYSYFKDISNNSTSGNLFSFPYFGHPTKSFFNLAIDTQPVPLPSPPNIFYTDAPASISDVLNWKMFEKSNLNQDITSGAYIGYSRVIENEIGKGSKELKFTSSDSTDFKNYIHRYSPPEGNDIFNLYFANGYNNCISEFIIANSGMGCNIFTDNSFKRGKLLEENVFNDAYQILHKKVITYNENLINTFSFQNGITFPYPDNLSGLMTVEKTFKIAQFLPTSETVSTYDASGNHKDITEIFTFNNFSQLKTNTIQTTDKLIEKRYFYPQDLVTEPMAIDLIAKNIINTPLKTESYVNTIKTGESKTVYANDATTSNLTLPKYSYAKKGNDIDNPYLETIMTYDKYDAVGNLLQYTQQNGISVSLIWGYNKTKLVAKVENVLYSTIPSALITAIETASVPTATEASLLTALTNLRGSTAIINANAMVTTYTYKQLVGISTVTDPKGDIQMFTYDSLGRLQNVKDKDGNIISENQYHYKNQ